MKRMAFVLGAFCAASAVSVAGAQTPPICAELRNVEGDVSVNQGDGFSPISGPVGLSVGDRVMTNGGQAELFYNAQCVIPLETQSVVTIDDPCACPVAAGPGPGLGTILAGGVVAGALFTGAGILFFADDNGNGDDKKSPDGDE